MRRGLNLKTEQVHFKSVSRLRSTCGSAGGRVFHGRGLADYCAYLCEKWFFVFW